MYRLRKGAPGSGIELNPVFKEINRLRNGIKGVVTSGQDPTQLNFQYIKKELKESLESGVVVHVFNPSTQKAKTDWQISKFEARLIYRPSFRIASLVSESQKSGEDIFE